MHPANGCTVVTQLRNDQRDYFPAEPKKLQMKAVAKAREELESLPLMHVGSELLSINDYPTRANTHAQVVTRLQHASWPVRLKLRRPLRLEEITPLDRIEELKNPSVRLQAFKRLLIYGARLNLHKKKTVIDSRLWLTPTFVNWRDEKLCSPFTKKEYSDPKFSKDQEMSKFLAANGLKHLEKSLIDKGPNADPEDNINTLADLCEFNGQRVIKGNYLFTKTYADLGINSADDQEKLFKATSKWLAATVSDELSTQGSRNLYDILFVRPGKQGCKGFTKEAKEGHCFTLHFDIPQHTIRVGERTKKPPGVVSSVLDDAIVITSVSGKTVKLAMDGRDGKKTKKALEALAVSFSYPVSIDIGTTSTESLMVSFFFVVLSSAQIARSTTKTTLEFEVPKFPAPEEFLVTGRELTREEKEWKEKELEKWVAGDDERRREARDICVSGWKKIIEEVRNSQYVIDQAGIPKRRYEAPVVLSMMS